MTIFGPEVVDGEPLLLDTVQYTEPAGPLTQAEHAAAEFLKGSQPVHRAACRCGWKASAKDYRRLQSRAVHHCESCGGPIEIRRAA